MNPSLKFVAAADGGVAVAVLALLVRVVRGLPGGARARGCALLGACSGWLVWLLSKKRAAAAARPLPSPTEVA